MTSRPLFVLITLLLASTALFGQDSPKDLTPTPPAASSDAEPQADASGIYKAGGAVTPPKVTFSAEPTYSQKARAKRLEGFCTIGLIVDGHGNPQNIRVIKSLAEGLSDDERSAALSLDEKAIKAVRKYRFEPSMLHGRPVPVHISVEVHFQIVPGP